MVPRTSTLKGGYMSTQKSASDRIAEIVNAFHDTRLTPLDLARMCGGYYECPKSPDGKRLGPLVGYAGRDELGRQYVGDIYVNFAQVERYGRALLDIARKIK
jgi:hypothetical protein